MMPIQSLCVTFMKQLPIIIILLTLTCCNDTNSDKIQHTSSDTIAKSISTINSNSNTTLGKLIKFTSDYNFETFKAKIFTGKTALPDFTDNEFASDKEYIKFITDGCKKNDINFGGHYTIIQRSCGAMCEHIFIVDRINGKIFTDIKPNDGRYGYFYKKDSHLLIANSNVFQDDSLKYYNDIFGNPELYVWKNNNFQFLK
jgi:hypothetical protein